ncbi:transcriptional regulator with XRE-family HTH domain [Desulfitispora alkaliphila]|uniref:helix-turn-helix transcriptional regulator n=1 Tax=Desulfitispora alkaliphila TaxID=622674 RepID=UPI003D1FBE6A
MNNWLKKKRISKGMTHDEVAKAANIKRAYYTMIENGNRTPSVSVAKKISSVLGFEWIKFFER